MNGHDPTCTFPAVVVTSKLVGSLTRKRSEQCRRNRARVGPSVLLGLLTAICSVPTPTQAQTSPPPPSECVQLDYNEDPMSHRAALVDPVFLSSNDAREWFSQRVVRPTPANSAFRWATVITYANGLGSLGLPPLDPSSPFGVSLQEYGSTAWGSLCGYTDSQGDYAPFKSQQGGFSLQNQDSGRFQLAYGERLPINLCATPGLGDGLPAASTIGESSAALLPPGVAGKPTGWQGESRPVLDGSLDLVTGSPLVQLTDLELPFGSAEFRLVRTRSANPARDFSHDLGTARWIRGGDRWWDWAGTGWMVSENPFLLIDSQVPDLVGPNPRVAWLVLDAHHSIPFQQVNLAPGPDGQPQVGYEAPPRFRARMKHSGGIWAQIPDPTRAPTTQDPSPTRYGWQVPPSQYEVWLYDGALKYTFVAVRDDVPPRRWNRNALDANPQNADWKDLTYHEGARYPDGVFDGVPDGYYWSDVKNPGFGVPYYGLCVRIEDQFDNRADMYYAEVTRDNIDDPDPASACTETLERAYRKGQLTAVQLSSPGVGSERNVEWTLLYAHRLFRGTCWNAPTALPPPYGDQWPFSLDKPYVYMADGSSMIDRIFVFKGDPISAHVELDRAIMEIPSEDDPYSATAADPLTLCSSLSSLSLSNLWVHQVRYHYAPANGQTVGFPELAQRCPTPLHSPPILVRTSVTSRREAPGGGFVTGSEVSRHTFFRYAEADQQHVEGDPGFNVQEWTPWLSGISRTPTSVTYEHGRRHSRRALTCTMGAILPSQGG